MAAEHEQGSFQPSPESINPIRSIRATDRIEPGFRGVIQRRIVAIAALTGTILFFIYDIAADWLNGEYGSFHFIIELIVFVGVSLALVVGLRDLHRVRVQLTREERRNKALSTALAGSIDDQMDEWRMTRSEKDVAWFIIKGCRFSEIAELRSVKESTARLQATSVYAKAGVSGRAEFVAEVFQPLLMDIPSDPSLRREKAEAGRDRR